METNQNDGRFQVVTVQAFLEWMMSAQRRTGRETQIDPPRVQFSGLQRLLRPQPVVLQRHEPSTDRQ